MPMSRSIMKTHKIGLKISYNKKSLTTYKMGIVNVYYKNS